MALVAAGGNSGRACNNFAEIIIKRVQNVSGICMVASRCLFDLHGMAGAAVFWGYESMDRIAVVLERVRSRFLRVMAGMAINAVFRMCAQFPFPNE